MFGIRYWARRFFAKRYFPGGAESATGPIAVGPLTGSANSSPLVGALDGLATWIGSVLMPGITGSGFATAALPGAYHAAALMGSLPGMPSAPGSYGTPDLGGSNMADTPIAGGLPWPALPGSNDTPAQGASSGDN